MHPDKLKQLVKECILEVLKEELTQSDFEKKIPKPDKKEIPIDWDDKSEDGDIPIKKEAFDPLSQGPNPDNKENPYPEWNAKMRRLEEDEVHENANYQKMININNEKTLKLYHHLYKQTGEFEHGNSGNMLTKFGFTFGTEDEPMSYYKKLPNGSLQVMFLPSNKFLVTKHLDGKQMGSFTVLNNESELFDWVQSYSNISENEHGRYAQDAGAGQFDPRTFGKLDEIHIDEDGYCDDVKCPKCKSSEGAYLEEEWGRYFWKCDNAWCGHKWTPTKSEIDSW